MPLAVLDVRARIRSTGPQFTVGAADLRSWERRHASLRAAVYYS